MNERLVVFGAGTTGRVIARDLNAKGTPALCFVDSNQAKHGLKMEGIDVVAPEVAKLLYPDATWVAAAIVPEFWKEITVNIAELGVKTMSVWGFLPQRHTPPSRDVARKLRSLVGHDERSLIMVNDQINMRNDPEHYVQEAPDDINEIYWPEFITRRDDEVLLDAGAADGDTVTEFLKRWPKYKWIHAIEPDRENFIKLGERHEDKKCISFYPCGVADYSMERPFASTGDYSAHFATEPQPGGFKRVPCYAIDDLLFEGNVPTYIKMDIEGSEPAALWGARRILKEHRPVLAVCAYHEASHFWELPLLIHALQPDYRLFFRRYAEGSFEIVWYAVPPERLK